MRKSMVGKVLLSALLIGAVGCGGGGSSSGQKADETAPEVVTVAPADASWAIPVGSTVTAEFSEKIKAESLTGASFTLTSLGGAVAGEVTLDASGLLATFTPSAPLALDTTYTATLTAAVEDKAGNALAEEYAWTFTTPAATRLASANLAGNAGSASSSEMDISEDGTYVAFRSASNDLTAEATSVTEVFVRNIKTGVTVLASVNSDETPADAACLSPTVSGDGAKVAFHSAATNLGDDDSSSYANIYVRNLTPGTTQRITLTTDASPLNGNCEYPALSRNGNFVAFQSDATKLVSGDTNGVYDIFVANLATGVIERISVDGDGTEGNGASYKPAISDDGRYVAFYSLATNLSAEADANGVADVFVHDRQTGATTRVSVDSEGNEGNGTSGFKPAISGTGKYVAFLSEATDLAPGDTNGFRDAFVFNRDTGDTTLVSASTTGGPGNGDTGWTAEGTAVSISSNGRYVGFSSGATNLVADDANGKFDCFVRDLLAGTTALVTVNNLGEQANNHSWPPALSNDGRYAAFMSLASNLNGSGTDTNNAYDIYVRGSLITTDE